MRESFRQQLRESGYIHTLLPLDLQNATETRLLEKKAVQCRSLFQGDSMGGWTSEGVGELLPQEGCMRIVAPARVEPEAPMPHYRGFSNLRAALSLPGEDWRSFNRVVCRIKPACMGFHKPFLTIHLKNEGEIKIPDVYNREGSHVVNLQNHVWNECVWEFPDLPRDKITEISFSLSSHGKELFGHEDFVYDIADIRLEAVENPDNSLGWQGNADAVSFSTTGYFTQGRKTAVAQVGEGDFALLGEADDTVHFQGALRRLENEKGVFGIADFTQFQTPGRYRLRVGDVVTKSFAIGAHVMDEAAWKAINYLYAERCGFPVSGGHSFCHSDIIAEHNGLKLSYCGGWHDAGDVSQQTLQSAEVVQALLELAGRVQEDTLLYTRLVEEAVWGLDFVIKTRFGDGFRATSAGMSRWTNTLMGDYDDEVARVHNRSFENFLMAGVEAYAGQALKACDPDRAWVSLRVAKDDFGFALERFNAIGMEHQINMEHTYNASLSQYYAVAAWSASHIYAACGEAFYAEQAAHFGNLMLSCQDRGQAGLPFEGFFYRDDTHQALVHFNHQSREHIFAQALQALCQTQPAHADLPRWQDGLRAYGGYIKAMHAYAAPYGMIPAGVHRYDEPDDTETFPYLHLYTTYEAERQNYVEQLENALRLDDAHCLKHFPVWFSFRGNTALYLSSGKAAAIIGNYFTDEALLDIARDQLYFAAGQNPFAQSLMYGEGSNYAQQYAALCGETVGEMPVGIQTRANDDEPYWPMANYATYKEIWTSSVGHWMRLVADLY